MFLTCLLGTLACATLIFASHHHHDKNKEKEKDKGPSHSSLPDTGTWNQSGSRDGNNAGTSADNSYAGDHGRQEPWQAGNDGMKASTDR